MDAVKSFNQELSSLYEVKPPISKAKMTALTRGAIKAIKFYKHVVQSVEKFILKCRPEYKVPGLYVIDSIVRQSRHQFGSDKDVFAPRFSKNMKQTFVNLFKCPPEDKSKIIRVLNLWQKNNVFAPEVIQPLFDLADPNNPIYKEFGTPVQQTNGLSVPTAAMAKGSPAMQRTPTKGNQPVNDSTHGSSANLNLTDPSVLQQLQQLQRLLTKNTEVTRAEPVHFDKKLLDFDYGDDDEEVNPSPRPQQPSANDSVSSLLTNPEVLRQLQTLQQTMANAQQQEMDMDKMRKLQEMKQQEEEFDKHLAQTVPNLPFAAECEFKPNNNTQIILPTVSSYYDNMNPPTVNYQSVNYELHQQQVIKTNVEINNSGVEVITLDHDDSRSDSEERYSKRRRSRSRSRDRRGRDRDRDRDRKKRSRSRSTSRRHRSRSRDRKQKEKEKETERDRERKKRGLPVIKKDHLSICSTTLWVGHLSKLVHQDDLSNTFGEFGDVVSIDLIPPRGCAFIVMLRRQDAARCLAKLKGHVLHGKAITLAWAPGKGVKGKDLKDYWEGDLGVSYIPYSKIKEDIDIEMLEDGGMIDEETMPEWMREKVDRMGKKVTLEMPQMVLGTEGAQIDTSQPPPIPGAGLLQAPPPPLLPIVSPFQFNNRLLGMNVPPGMMPNISNMPNIPLGVPPPNMTGAMMSNQLLGIGSPFQEYISGPPTMLPPPQMNPMDGKPTAPNADASLHTLSETLINLTQTFGMIPPAGPPPPQHQDDMDVEMEDAEKSEKERPNSDGGYRSGRDDRKENRRDDRDRRNRSRDRERDRDRDRDKDRTRDRRNSRDRDRDRRDSRGRDRDRDRDRRDDRDKRDRGNRWSDRDRSRDRRENREGRDADSRDERRDREKSLNDRLREMAGMGNYDDRDRNKDKERRDQALRFQPPERGSDDFSRTSGKNEFGFPRGQSAEKPDKVDVPGEEKTPDLNKENTRDALLDAPNAGTVTQNFQIESEGSQDMDSRLEGATEIVDRQLNDVMDARTRRAPNNLLDVMGAPLNMMEAPPHFLGGPPPHMMNRPLAIEDHRAMDRPPHIMMDRPPHMIDRAHPMLDGPPPYMMEDVPPEMLDAPPDIYFDRMGRRDMDGGRFRGVPRGGFVPRGMRGGPPPPEFEYFDNFPRDGPRGPMRGGPNFGPRGGRMMGPRGPRMPFFRGGPRGGRGGFRDSPNFNPRFDGPPEEFFRGPGGPLRMRPPIFNDGPPRFRGHRFDDRNWERPEEEYGENEQTPSQPGRQGRRSRWGNHEDDDEQVPGEEDYNKSSTTPVFDECPEKDGSGDENTKDDDDDNYQERRDDEDAETVHQNDDEAIRNDSSEQLQNEEENVENFESAGGDNFEACEDNYRESEDNFQNSVDDGDAGGEDEQIATADECNDEGAGEDENVATHDGDDGDASEPAAE